MNSELREQIERCNRREEHQKVIDVLETCTLHDYESASYLVRAYNSRGAEGDFDRAIELLKMMEDLGKEDPLWFYRMGYACFFSKRYADAQLAFEKVLELNPDDVDALEFFELCTGKILGDLTGSSGFPEPLSPICYADEERIQIENFICDHFGAFESVIREFMPDGSYLDFCVIEPDEDRDFYTLVTVGMGAYHMNIPEELSEFHLERAEFLICLPSEWNLDSRQEQWYWPVRMLKILAEIPRIDDTWLGWGHTVDFGDSFDKTSEFSGSMLISPASFEQEDFLCPMPDGSEVNFYQIIPLYRDELEFKMTYGADELLAKMDDSVLTVDSARSSFAGGKKLN